MARRNRVPPRYRRALYRMAVFDATHRFAFLPILNPLLLNRVIDRWADRIRARRTAHQRPAPSAADWG